MRLGQIVHSSGFMDHAIQVVDVPSRRSLFSERAAGKSVLHVGCCDVPVFDPNTNLHVFLAKHTDRLDGLDVSEAGIAVLRKYVEGDYFTTASAVDKEYELVLAPEVIEHTQNPGLFLDALFSVRAREYLITAPHIQWFMETRREGNVFHERVHPDHKVWYSPYTLLNTLRPFIDAAADDVEVWLLEQGVSVAVSITKPFVPAAHAPRAKGAEAPWAATLALANARSESGDDIGAARIVAEARRRADDSRLVIAHMQLLLGTGQTMEALRQGVGWLSRHPDDIDCLEWCAEAAELLGNHAHAARWRETARRRRSGA